jgi:hypothetical protein
MMEIEAFINSSVFDAANPKVRVFFFLNEANKRGCQHKQIPMWLRRNNNFTFAKCVANFF